MKALSATLLSFLFTASALAATPHVPQMGIPKSPVITCGGKFDQAASFIGTDGMPSDEKGFLAATKSTLETCRIQANAAHNSELEISLVLAQKACDKASNQQSMTYKGVCYHKAAAFAQFILE